MNDPKSRIETQRSEVRRLIEEIEVHKSLYYIAKLMHHTHGQVKRMRESGRCQPWQLEMIKEIHAEVVPCETAQNVSNETHPSQQHDSLINA